MWYAFQIAVIAGLIYLHVTKLSPDVSPWQIVLFAVLVAYALTWLLTKSFDLLRRIWRTCQLPRRWGS